LVENIFNGGNIMKIQNKFLKATMFAAVLLGATVTTQNVKADDVSDKDNDTNNLTTPVNNQKIYNGFTGTTESQDSSVQATVKDSNASHSSANVTSDVSSNTENTQTDWSNTRQFKPQNDYYQYTNHAWLTSTDVNKDKQDQGTILSTQQDVNSQVQNKFENYLNGTEHTTDPTMQKAIDFYHLYMSQGYTSIQQVNQAATKGIVKQLQELDGLGDIYELSDNLNRFLQNGVTLPIGVKIDIDQVNPSLRALYFYGAEPLLLDDNGDVSNSYSESQDTIGSFLTQAGYDMSNIESIITNTKKFDQILAKYQTKEDLITDHLQANYKGDGINRTTGYLPVNYVNFSNLSSFIDIDKFINESTGTTPGYVFEMTPSFYNNINEILTPENFQLMKAWMISNYILNSNVYLNQLSAGFPTVANETTEQFNQRLGYYLTKNAFSNEFSKYFGDVLLNQETRSAVNDMAKNIVSAYQSEISESSWLSAASKQAAINKLNNIKINVGYPKDSYSFYNTVSVPTTGDFYQTYRNIMSARSYQPFLDYNKPVDRTEWGSLSSLDVNAQYSASRNAIFIGTGIIQSPFFDVSQTDSQNYAGLGTIIGHELSHAFDRNGSLYDANGLVHNWWSNDDFHKYLEKSDQIIKEYDQQTFETVALDGENVANEALADNAGLNVSERALAQKGNANWDQYFKAYAAVNRHKYYIDSRQTTARLNKLDAIKSDPHAPFPIRVNVTLRDNTLFDQTYGVKSGDGMYKGPSTRFDFWA
jgi:putative endopeptidase